MIKRESINLKELLMLMKNTKTITNEYKFIDFLHLRAIDLHYFLQINTNSNLNIIIT